MRTCIELFVVPCRQVSLCMALVIFEERRKHILGGKPV